MQTVFDTSLVLHKPSLCDGDGEASLSVGFHVRKPQWLWKPCVAFPCKLADGFLHFSFAASPNVGTISQGEELGSSHGEHIAGIKASPKRLQSNFRKQSPIPVASARRKKRQAPSFPPQENGQADGVISVKSLSRPKSLFSKRSPIPERKKLRSVASLQQVVVDGNNKELKKEIHHHDQPHQNLKEGGSTAKSKSQKRPSSRFVKRLPVPTQNARSEPSLKDSQESFNGAIDSTSEAPREHFATQSSRPKSKFVRRSPITKLSVNGAIDDSKDNLSQSSRPKSKFVRRSPVGVKKLEVAMPQISAKESLISKALKTNGAPQKKGSKVDGAAEKVVKGALKVSPQKEMKDTVKRSGNAWEEEKEASPKSDSKKLLSHESGAESSDLKPCTDPHLDLSKCKLAELKTIAKAKGVKGYSRMKKGELLEVLLRLRNDLSS